MSTMRTKKKLEAAVDWVVLGACTCICRASRAQATQRACAGCAPFPERARPWARPAGPARVVTSEKRTAVAVSTELGARQQNRTAR